MKAMDKRLLLIAAVLSLIVTMAIYKYLSELNKPQDEVMKAVVYTASQNIPARSIIVKEMLRASSVPIDLIHPEAVKDINDIIGKITTDRLIAGELILLSRLAGEQTNQLSFKIPKGKRAVSISANEVIIVSNLIKPGDFVDILLTIDPSEEIEGYKEIQYLKSTSMIMQNVEVLAVGTSLTGESVDGEMPRAITLAVSPKDSEKLVLAEESGRIRLALRPAVDDETVNTNGALKNELPPKRGILVK